MKAHVPTTSLHWQDLNQQARPLSRGEYEEWRSNPVTVQLFNDFERKTFEASAVLADTKPTNPSLPNRHADLYAWSMVVTELFEWTPPGIELDGEFGDV